MDPKDGSVALVGAGPGAPGLITLRGVELLTAADVVLYDGLVNAEILVHAPPHAELLCVGKHGHGGMWTQKEIDDRTVEFAKSGKRVVRLKGGDTAIFARTAEEVDRLVSEGIPYEIVPGITAALAATAYAGVPLTHRDWSSAVALVTGQLQPSDGNSDADDSMDWKGLAQFPGTLVLYMGVTTADHWSRQLIDAGKSPSTPVAIARRVSCNDQQVLRCTLGTVAQTLCDTPRFRPPVISIIGEVSSLPMAMNWFSDRPLFGARYLIASPEHTGRKLQLALSELGAAATLQPALETPPLTDWERIDPVLTRLATFDWIVFSSPIGVDAFFRRLKDLRIDGRSFPNTQLASVGAPTSSTIREWNLCVDLEPESPGIEKLVPQLAPLAQGKRVLLVRPPEGRTIGQDLLEKAGAHCESLAVYSQQKVTQWPAVTLKDCESGRFDGILVSSLHVAEQVVKLISPNHSKQTWYSIAPRVSQRLRELGCQHVVTAEHAHAPSMVECVLADYRSKCHSDRV